MKNRETVIIVGIIGFAVVGIAAFLHFADAPSWSPVAICVAGGLFWILFIIDQILEKKRRINPQ